jgi:peptidoglycan LD-endopeptidase CwlK
MPKFSPVSNERLSTCDAQLIALFNYVIMHWDCSVLEGYRSKTRQLDLYEQGKTKVKEGKHNVYPSLAIDVAPYPINWQDIPRFYYFAGFVMGIAKMMGIQVRWGGDWDSDKEVQDQTFNDLVHFELA